MKLQPIKSYPLEKCYCVAPLYYNGEACLLAAAEKTDRCILFSAEGEKRETIWDAPGGTMSIAQIPGTNGDFLATQRFYSPNDSENAIIVHVHPRGKDDWVVKTVAALPFAHRFDILQRNQKYYIIACTLKSAHQYKDDWSAPGKVYVAELPESFEEMNESNPLNFQVLRDGLTKNHGLCRCHDTEGDFVLIGAENGVFRVVPPDSKRDAWQCEQLADTPTSDVASVDFDGDGENELITISPFHGDAITILKRVGKEYRPVYVYPEKAEFAHAIWAGELGGVPTAIIGHRKGSQSILAFTYQNGVYQADALRSGCGSANILHYCKDGKEYLLSANRETDEAVFYEVEP